MTILSKRQLIKTAWHWSDVAGAVGLDLLVDVGLMGALGSMGVFSGGATGVAGASAAILGTGPVGVAIGAILLAGGVGYAIYEGTKMADDNAQDLLKRIEDLDYEGTQVEQIVENWITRLTGFQKIFQLPAGEGSPEEKIKAIAEQLKAMTDAITYMRDEMLGRWPVVKAHLRDQWWEYDKEQFENALKTTIANYQNTIKNVNDESKRQATKLQTQQGSAQSKKTDLTHSQFVKLISEIQTLNTQLTNSWGPPKYDENELALLQNGKQLVTGLFAEKQITPEMTGNISKLTPGLNKLKTDLQWLSGQVARRKKTSSIQFSKRAVELPNIPSPKTRRQQGTGLKATPVVENLQRALNQLKVAAQMEEVPYIDPVDGVYGPTTAAALVGVLNKFTKLADYIRLQGVPINKLTDLRFMNAETGGLRFINLLSNIFAIAIKQLTAPAEQKPETTEPVQEGAGCNWRKLNPNTQEVMACLKSSWGYVGGTRVNIYEFLRSKGLDENWMLRAVQNSFGGATPSSWKPQTLIDRAMGIL